jgi:hypothetical protein
MPKETIKLEKHDIFLEKKIPNNISWIAPKAA